MLDCEWPEGFGGCLRTGSPIFADPSVKPIETIAIGDRVLTEDGRFHRVKRTFIRHYDGPMYTLHTKYYGIPVSLTPEHPVMVRRLIDKRQELWKNRRLTEPSWVPASRVQKGDYLGFPIPMETRDLDTLRLCEFASNAVHGNKSGLLYSSGKLPKTAYRTPATKDTCRYGRGIPHEVTITNNLLRLFGYHIADGSASSNRVVLFFTRGQDELADDAIRIFRETFGLEGKKKLKKNVLTVRVNSKILSGVLRKLFGADARNKCIPQFLMLLPPWKQASLIDGLIAGDGYRRESKTSLKTSSMYLAHQTFILYLRQKKVPSLQHGVAKERLIEGGRRLGRSDYYSVSVYKKPQSRIYDGSLLMPLKKVDVSPFTGEVHNFAVEGKNSYVPGFVVHNCNVGEAIYCNCTPIVWNRKSKEECYPTGAVRVPLDDYESMAEAAARVLTKGEFPITENDRKFVREFRSIESHARGLIEAFQKVVK
jgi:hypothetical protein